MVLPQFRYKEEMGWEVKERENVSKFKSAVGWIEVSLLEMKKGDEVMIDKNGALKTISAVNIYFRVVCTLVLA